MTRKKRLGSDPLASPEGGTKKGKKDGRGVDSLIRDTRGEKEDASSKSGPKKKAAGKKKTVQEKKAKPRKKVSAKKRPAPKKKAALKKKTAPAKTKKELIAAVPKETPAASPPLETQVRPPEPPTAAPEPKAAPRPEAPPPEREKRPPREETLAEKTRPESAPESEESRQFLGFRLLDEYFAFKISCVREVLTFSPITKVPQTREFMAGVINLRGSVVPVVDLRLLFSLTASEPTVDTCIIIVETDYDGEKMLVGAIADAVREVFDLKPSEIEPAPSMGAHLDVEFLDGMGKKGDEFVLILNTARIFSPEALEAG